VCSELTLQQTN